MSLFVTCLPLWARHGSQYDDKVITGPTVASGRRDKFVHVPNHILSGDSPASRLTGDWEVAPPWWVE